MYNTSKPSNVPPPKAVILPLDEGAGFAGKWEIVSENAGVSAMHLVIMKHGKAIMFDTTALGPSLMRLPEGNCREIPNGKDGALDCWAHAVEFDYNTGESRRLKVSKFQVSRTSFSLRNLSKPWSFWI